MFPNWSKNGCSKISLYTSKNRNTGQLQGNNGNCNNNNEGGGGNENRDNNGNISDTALEHIPTNNCSNVLFAYDYSK